MTKKILIEIFVREKAVIFTFRIMSKAVCSAYSLLGHLLNGLKEGVQSIQLPASDILIEIARETQNILKKESTILYLRGQFEVVGDIHGDVESLLTIFEKNGYPCTTNYVFLGDYVDRGHYSIEVVLILFCLKILYPNNIYLIRGNHECASVSKRYDFRDDCVNRVNMPFFKSIMRAFNVLPLAAVINSEIFCCHGGIPQTEMKIEEFKDIPRPVTKDYKDIQEDLLWSDPKADLTYDDFEFNTARKAGSYFGRKALIDFLENNGFTYVIRAHEVCQDGFELPLGEDYNCVTIFSSVGHRNGNIGATITVGEDRSVSLTPFENDEEEFTQIQNFLKIIAREHVELTPPSSP